MPLISSPFGTPRTPQKGSTFHKPPNPAPNHIHAPRVTLPARSCDCHVHVFDPARFPYADERSYTPGPAGITDLEAFERQIGTDRVILVQPSSYGTDNSCLIDALRRLGRRARGVAVVDPLCVVPAQIDMLHAAGVRAIRLNLEVKGEHDAERGKAAIADALDVVAGPEWAIQIHADLGLIQHMAGTISQARVPFILDHFGGLKAEKGLGQPGFEALLDLLRNGNVYVKLSAPYRASRLASYADLAPFARRLIETAPDHLIWASDWPHTGSSSQRNGDLSRIEPFRQVDAGAALDLLRDWAPDESVHRNILVETPARLYDFAD